MPTRHLPRRTARASLPALLREHHRGPPVDMRGWASFTPERGRPVEYRENPMSRIDACPRCRHRQLTAPYAVTAEGRDGYTVAYRCADCGHVWRTSWAASARTA